MEPGRGGWRALWPLLLALLPFALGLSVYFLLHGLFEPVTVLVLDQAG